MFLKRGLYDLTIFVSLPLVSSHGRGEKKHFCSCKEEWLWWVEEEEGKGRGRGKREEEEGSHQGSMRDDDAAEMDVALSSSFSSSSFAL